MFLQIQGIQKSFGAGDSRVDVPSLMAVCTMPGYRSRLRLSAGEPPRLQLHLSPGEDALAAAKAEPKVAAEIAGKSIVKEIYVPGKLVNIVAR